MKRLAGLIALFVFAAAPLPLMAYPDGAPWGSADPDAPETCSSCHFDGAPTSDSDAITMDGFPESVMAGDVYELVIAFAKPEGRIAGFLAVVSAGVFEVGEGQEALANEVRSVVPVGSKVDAVWTVKWRAPRELPAAVTIDIAANAGNDDHSPFGDEVHYRQYVLSDE